MPDLDMFGGGEFDATQVDPSAPRTTLPPGDYLAWIVKSEMKDTANGGGKYLSLEYDILEGEYKGSKFWDNLNLVNSGPKAQQVMEIARATLSAICHATGQMRVKRSEDLHTKPLIAVLSVEEDSRDANKPAAERRTQNRVKGYKAANTNGQTFQPPAQRQPPANGGYQQQPSAPPQGAGPAGGNMPWKR